MSLLWDTFSYPFIRPPWEALIFRIDHPYPYCRERIVDAVFIVGEKVFSARAALGWEGKELEYDVEPNDRGYGPSRGCDGV